MAKEQVVNLFRAAQVNPSLKEELNAAPNVESFVKMANSLGYEFTVDEWKDMTRFAVEEFETKLSAIPGI